jgi:hypothetical protein
VFRNDRVCRRQTETAAGLFRREVRIEDSWQHVSGDAVSGLADGHSNACSRPRFSVAVRIDVVGAHLDRAAVRHRLLRVEKDVVEHLTHLIGVDVGRPQIVRHLEGYSDGRTRKCEPDRIRD